MLLQTNPALSPYSSVQPLHLSLMAMPLRLAGVLGLPQQGLQLLIPLLQLFLLLA